LFTQDFRKFWNTLIALVTVAIIYLGVNGLLHAVSTAVERKGDFYPYQQEDWLRYLLPSLFQNKGRSVMLVGESAVRENFLYEEFNKAFSPMHTFQGGMSLGTIDDVLISLEYIKRVYGRGALPKMIVLGISPRFVANVPEDRPFAAALDRYSPYFRVERTAAGPSLVAKTQWQGWFSRLRFMIYKQQERYWGAVVALARGYLKASKQADRDAKPARASFSLLIDQPLLSLERMFESVLSVYVRHWVLPYKYHHLKPWRADNLRRWLVAPDSWWRQVHAWEPQSNWQMVAGRLIRFKEFVESENISLYVINLPEHLESRRLYKPKNYEQYLELVQSNLDNGPFLDLRDLLGSEEFYDIVHATLPGARRVTESVIHFITDHRKNALKLNR
jgi:hypothetical protein